MSYPEAMHSFQRELLRPLLLLLTTPLEHLLHLRDVPQALSIPLPKGHCYATTQRLEDLIAGDERPRREAGGQVWGEAGEPGSHEDALQATFGIDEALGGVYENAALGDEGSLFVVDFSIAPVRLGGHLLEEASAAECRLQAVSFGLRNMSGIQVSAWGQRIRSGSWALMISRRSKMTVLSGPSSLLLRPLRTSMLEISLGIEGSPATCISRLVKGISKSGENRVSSLSPQGKRSCSAM